jgi:acyl carrier protein
MDEQLIVDRTRDYVRRTFLYARPDLALRDEDRLLERGIIDSMGVLELLGFLEQEFGVTLVDEDITEQNLGTIQSIARCVSTRLKNRNSRVPGGAPA